MQDADLFQQADLIREAMAMPGWAFVADSIQEHERKMNDQLLNETTRAEEIPRLRGLITGLRSMQQAADSIVAYAVEREAAANKRIAQEQPA